MAAGGAAVYHAGKSSGANAAQAAQQEPAAEGSYQQPAAAPMPAAPAAGGMSQDQINQLTQLGQLHEQGVLTDEEFAAQKAKILG
jgi:hypothetical protein